ncbi:MAG TPA: hypothetical protein VFN74_07695 [Chloroflexota bacterium]|nr:hypothetical protein [Chloroflexota bacterium]
MSHHVTMSHHLITEPLDERAIPEDERHEQAALVSLTPAESKRLIAKAAVRLPVVRRALRQGRVILALGTTNAFIAEELLGHPIPKYNYAAGFVDGTLNNTDEPERILPYIWRFGHVVEVETEEVLSRGPTASILEEMDADDVFFKGANAVDTGGNAGVFTGNDRGGTCGGHMGIVLARGVNLVIPVGLEKLVPSVIEASRVCGIGRFAHATGQKVGLWPIVNGLVLTEIQALESLFDVRVTHVGSGGIGGGEGSVVLAIGGDARAVRGAYELVTRIKGEPPLTVERGARLGTLAERAQARN